MNRIFSYIYYIYPFDHLIRTPMKRILYLLCLLTGACSTAHAQHHVSFNPQPFQEVVAPIRLIGTGDINGDGRVDIVGASSMQAGSTLTILLWLQGNDGKLLPVQPFHHPAPAFKTLSSLLVADLHKDGKNEVVVGLSNTLYIYSWQANALVRTDSFIHSKLPLRRRCWYLPTLMAMGEQI
jgi:hypothetical protein